MRHGHGHGGHCGRQPLPIRAKIAVAQRGPNPGAMPFFHNGCFECFRAARKLLRISEKPFFLLILEKTILRAAWSRLSLVCRLWFCPQNTTVHAQAELSFSPSALFSASCFSRLGVQLLCDSNCLRVHLSPQRLFERLQDWVFGGIWDIDNFSKFIDSRDWRFATSRSPRGRDPVHVPVRRQAEHAGGLPAETLRVPLCQPQGPFLDQRILVSPDDFLDHFCFQEPDRDR